MELLSVVVWLADGRGDSPGTTGGILAILGIVLSLIVLGFAGHWLVSRFGQTKRKSLDHESHEPGRVGRGGKRRG